VKAVDGVSLEVPEGSIFGLIGPNGAGKTTLVNVISGYVRPQAGTVTLGGVQIQGRAPHRIAGLGVARTFQTIRLYRELTAIENVLVGMHLRRRDDTLQQLALLPVFRRGQHERVTEARELLAKVGLDPAVFADRKARTLAYGDQRRLEVARALALRPRLLVLDEPAAGMNPTEKDRIRELIERVNSEGLTVLLIDHDMKLVLGVSSHLAVLNFGRKIAEGAPEAVAADPEVVEAYLGRRQETIPADSASRSSARSEPAGEAGTLLEVRDLSIAYGAIEAVREVSLEVRRGEVVALIGANGAGKSTILNTLSGVIRPRSGTAVFDGLDLTSAAPHRIVAHGLVQVPEGREVLAGLTVLENLELGTWGNRDHAAARRRLRTLMDRFPILRERSHLPAGQLSGGEQQILAIARGLVASPRLLLLDEPSLGLAPQMVDEVFRIIREIAEDGVTILLVEQNAARALEVSDRAYVLETGRVELSGTGSELLQNPEVQRAYLGV
jgi:branched-chain amino acid transport system ATP-binding protein